MANFKNISYRNLLFFAIIFIFVLIFFKISYLKNQIKLLEKKNEEAISELKELKLTFGKALLNLLEIQEGEIEKKLKSMFVKINIEDKNYSILKTEYGSFIVSCENIWPYLDGYKVLIVIGNLTTAKFIGADLLIKWGIAKNSKFPINLPEISLEDLTAKNKTEKKKLKIQTLTHCHAMKKR